MVLKELVIYLGLEVDPTALGKAQAFSAKVNRAVGRASASMNSGAATGAGAAVAVGMGKAAKATSRASKSIVADTARVSAGYLGMGKSMNLLTPALMMGGGPMLAIGAAAVGVMGVAAKATMLASNAVEMLNVLSQAFGENSNEVMAWAKETSDIMGRSEFGIRKMAGDIGSVLQPMMDYDTRVVTDMSKKLTELAIDIGSFRDSDPTEVLLAMRAAMTGESEPMKRFGIVITETTLKSFLLKQGIVANTKMMTLAEKTQLRYNYLMSMTSKYQGDAVRTGDQFANMWRRTKGVIEDAFTKAGMLLLPRLMDIMHDLVYGPLKGLGGGLVNVFRILRLILVPVQVFIKSAKFVVKLWGKLNKYVKITLGFFMALKLASLAIAIPWLGMLIAVTAVVLVIESFVTFLEGGDSAIGDILEKFKDLTGWDMGQGLKDFLSALDEFSKKGRDDKAGDSQLIGFWDEVILILKLRFRQLKSILTEMEWYVVDKMVKLLQVGGADPKWLIKHRRGVEWAWRTAKAQEDALKGPLGDATGVDYFAPPPQENMTVDATTGAAKPIPKKTVSKKVPKISRNTVTDRRIINKNVSVVVNATTSADPKEIAKEVELVLNRTYEDDLVSSNERFVPQGQIPVAVGQ